MLRPEPSCSSSFAKDVLKLVTGTTLAQVITVLAAPACHYIEGLSCLVP